MNEHYLGLQKQLEEAISNLELPSKPNRLYDPVRYIMALGGKRVRPMLTLLGCELFGGQASEAMPQALAVEIFHNFTLVHDDMMDSAEVRRKLPTVHKKWDNNVALLSGDGMLVIAYQQLFKSKTEHLAALADVFSDTALEVCEGQQLDMDYAELDQVSLAEYLEMIRLKTAVLLSCSLQLGAIVAGAAEADLKHLKTFAEGIGLAFQVRDDYLDAFGGDDFGKAIGGDIKEGKRTWLTVKSLEVADAETKEQLLKAYEVDDLEQRVAQVLAIYEKTGVAALAEETVKQYSEQALISLEAMSGKEEIKEILRALVDRLIGRTS